MLILPLHSTQKPNEQHIEISTQHKETERSEIWARGGHVVDT